MPLQLLKNLNCKDKRIHLPSYFWNFSILRSAPLTFIMTLLAFAFVFVNEGDWSGRSIKIYLMLMLVVSIFFGLIVLWAYFRTRKSDTFLFIEDGNLLITKNNILKKYEIDSVARFVVTNIRGLSGSGVVKKELFIEDEQGERLLLYTDDWTTSPRGAWEKAMMKLEIETGKRVNFKDYIEDSNGQIFEKGDYYKNQAKKTAHLNH